MDLSGDVNPDPRRKLPSVDRLSREVAEACPELPQWSVVEAARVTLRLARIRLEEAASLGDGRQAVEQVLGTNWPVKAAVEAARISSPHPRRVVNATGVVLHTNLGRSPLSPGAAQAAANAAAGYSNLELDLETGRRGNRLSELSAKICLLAGVEAATVVNNNAAAVLLALNTLAAGREVVVSRGELVEIGGSFRVPAIMERAGVRLVEVGTTNRTHAKDYEMAIGPDTGLLLKVHRSNFEQRGYVAEVDLETLVGIGRAHGVPVVEDLGAGTLLDFSEKGLPRDAFAPGRMNLGPDLVCFSGDKLLGGPQAGIILGTESVIAELRSNPLARALRLDKMTIAALDWTLDAMLDGRGPSEVPVLKMILESSESLAERARALALRLEPFANGKVAYSIEKDRVPVGGGSLPGIEFDSWVIAVRRIGKGPKPDQLARALRQSEVPVLARVRDGALLLNLRTVGEQDIEILVQALAAALR